MSLFSNQWPANLSWRQNNSGVRCQNIQMHDVSRIWKRANEFPKAQKPKRQIKYQDLYAAINAWLICLSVFRLIIPVGSQMDLTSYLFVSSSLKKLNSSGGNLLNYCAELWIILYRHSWLPDNESQQRLQTLFSQEHQQVATLGVLDEMSHCSLTITSFIPIEKMWAKVEIYIY